MNLQDAVVYDIENFPNCFTLHAEGLFGDFASTWEISQFRDDRRALFQWFWHCKQNRIPMIGFNNCHYDYPVIHAIFHNPEISVEQIFAKGSAIIHSRDQFEHSLWTSDEFAPQIDLMKVHHFDNNAKRTSLKALEINMRSPNVVDMPVKVETYLTEDEVNRVLVPYNIHDVRETKQFAIYSLPALEFRVSMIDQLGPEAINYNDSKIGSKLLEKRLGDDICYKRVNGRKQKRQTVRNRIALNDIIFPYIQFRNPEFQRVLDYMRAQVLKPSDIVPDSGLIKVTTKGVFAGLKAHVGGVNYHFGTGGIHASVESQQVRSTNSHVIRDIDVASLYPSIAIVNGLFPEHLGARFTEEYARLPIERQEWQKKKGKKCSEANSIKLAANGTYGNSNSPYSVFYDAKFTMTITINGQLLLAMLAEQLAEIPTLKVIQANTDGISYYIDRRYEHHAERICREWEKVTALVLEDVTYSRMMIADVNNYIAESEDGSLKQKGKYWHPDPLDYHASISQQQPPAWHKDLGNIVSIRAAVAAMVEHIDVEQYIRTHSDPFDFMLRYKAARADQLSIDGRVIQNTTRYFVSTDGGAMVKTSPARGPVGQPKKANGVNDLEYNKVMQETGGQWDARVCTKNKSVYDIVKTSVQSGFKVTECNSVDDFNWRSVNYDYYIAEARKLMI